jgi:hypothetical protein
MISGLPRIAIAMTAAEYLVAVDTFRTVFGMHVNDMSDRTVPDLGAHVGMCQPLGGSNVELMAPSDPDAPLSMALNRFLNRRGTGLYALMLEAATPNVEADELALRGVNVLPAMAGATGRDVHPNSTHGVLMRVYPTGSVHQPDEPAVAAPHLSGIVRVIVATDDASVAAKAYEHGLGLDVTHAEPDTERGVLVAHAIAPRAAETGAAETGAAETGSAGNGSAVIELVSPLDESRPFAGAIASHLRDKGQGMAALVLSADAPVRAAELLAERGLASDLHGPFGPEVTAFGTRFVIAAS